MAYGIGQEIEELTELGVPALTEMQSVNPQLKYALALQEATNLVNAAARERDMAMEQPQPPQVVGQLEQGLAERLMPGAQQMAQQTAPQQQPPIQQGVAGVPAPNMMMSGGGIVAFADGGVTDDGIWARLKELDRGLKEDREIEQQARRDRGRKITDYIPFMESDGELWLENILYDAGRGINSLVGDVDPRMLGGPVAGPALLTETETYLAAQDILADSAASDRDQAMARMQLEGLEEAPMRAEMLQQVDKIRAARQMGPMGQGIEAPLGIESAVPAPPSDAESFLDKLKRYPLYSDEEGPFMKHYPEVMQTLRRYMPDQPQTARWFTNEILLPQLKAAAEKDPTIRERFNRTFREARDRGRDTFEFMGNDYHTKYVEEMASGGIVGFANGGSISMALVDSLIDAESGGDPNAVSPAGAQGLTQVMPETGRQPGFRVTPLEDPFDPNQNRAFGEEYLGAMLARYDGDVETALVAYNAGPGNADKFIAAGKDYTALPKPEETKPYVNKVITGAKNRLAAGVVDAQRQPTVEEAEFIRRTEPKVQEPPSQPMTSEEIVEARQQFGLDSSSYVPPEVQTVEDIAEWVRNNRPSPEVEEPLGALELLEAERQANIPMLADMGDAPGSEGSLPPCTGRRSRKST